MKILTMILPFSRCVSNKGQPTLHSPDPPSAVGKRRGIANLGTFQSLLDWQRRRAGDAHVSPHDWNGDTL